MKRFKFNFSDRRLMVLFLGIIVLSICTLTLAYAALSVSLNIQGNASVVASSWNIHFDNLIYDFRDENEDVNIVDDTTIKFTAMLDEPGDKFGFVVDVVNEGTIDAIIESIEKTVDLTAEQAKYIKYDISYASGESITSKQILEANSYVRLIVGIYYRNDIDAFDLPTSQTSLNLSFKLNYTQRDEEGTVVTNNGTKAFRVVNGDLNTLGSEICLGNECFYLVEKLEDEKGQLLGLFAKYNLNVGGSFNGKFDVNEKAIIDLYTDGTGLQDSRMIGANLIQNDSNIENNLPWHGVIPFSSSQYWSDSSTNVNYNEDSFAWKYTLDYAHYLGEQGYDIVNAMMPPIEFLNAYNCGKSSSTCEEAPEWLSSTSYWTMSLDSGSCIYAVIKNSGVSCFDYRMNWGMGVRPVIVLRDEK